MYEFVEQNNGANQILFAQLEYLTFQEVKKSG
jgi:hypothetical protein